MQSPGSLSPVARVAAALGWLILTAPRTADAGYSHYWTWRAAPEDAGIRAAVTEMRRIAEAGADLVWFEASNRGIALNGIGEGEHEPFEFPGRVGFNSTKTASKPVRRGRHRLPARRPGPLPAGGARDRQ